MYQYRGKMLHLSKRFDLAKSKITPSATHDFILHFLLIISELSTCRMYYFSPGGLLPKTIPTDFEMSVMKIIIKKKTIS